MATSIEVHATSPEHAIGIAAEIRKHWAVTSATSSGALVVVETSNRQAKGSVSNALRQLKVSFKFPSRTPAPQILATPAARASPSVFVNGAQGISQPQEERKQRSGEKRGRKSSRPSDEEFLISLQDRGLEGTASHYGVSVLTVKNSWVKAVRGAKALIPDGRKTR